MAQSDFRQASHTGQTTLEAQIADLRSALDEQRATLTQVIEQQQQAINDLRRDLLSLRAPQTSIMAPVAAPADGANAPLNPEVDATPAEQSAATPKARKATSRRGLLRGAAATAAAAAATVAVSGSQTANAAPLATGGTFMLGQTNDANATTLLIPTSGSTPNPLFRADNSSTHSVGIEGWSQSVFGGVLGSGSNGGSGVYANSDTGAALYATSASGVAVKAAGSGRIAQNPQSTAGAPTSGSYSLGEMIRDSNGEMWICLASGSPGTWVRLVHADIGANGGAITFLSKPLRLLDTRSGFPAYYTPGAQLAPGDHRYAVDGITFNTVTIPGTATGVVGNVQTINAAGAGFLAICPADVGFSGTSNLVFEPGQVIANSFTCGMGPLYNAFGQPNGIGLDVFINANPVDVIIDLFAVIL